MALTLFPFARTLPKVERCLDDKNTSQHNTQREISDCWRLSKRFPCNKDEDRRHEQDRPEASKEVQEALLQPLRRWWREDVLTVLLEATLYLLLRKALFRGGGEATEDLIDGYSVPVALDVVCSCQTFGRSATGRSRKLPAVCLSTLLTDFASWCFASSMLKELKDTVSDCKGYQRVGNSQCTVLDRKRDVWLYLTSA